MKNSYDNLMENNIMSSENQNSSDENKQGEKFKLLTYTSLKNLVTNFVSNIIEISKPKYILILSLLAILLAISISFTLIQTSNDKKRQKISIQSPTPSTTIQTDEDKLNIQKQVTEFNIELDAFDSSSQIFKPPQVDLDIEF